MVCAYGGVESRHNDRTFGWPNWFDHVKREVAACRKGAALFDLSSLAKFEVEVSVVRSLTYESVLMV